MSDPSPHGVTGPPLSVNRAAFTSRSDDEVARIFAQMYVANRTRFHELAPDAAVRATSATTPDLSVGQVVATGVSYTIDLDPFTELAAIIVDRGRFRTRTPAGDEHLRAGDGYCQPVGVPQHTDVGNVATRTITVPMAEAHRIAEELVDMPAGALVVPGGRPISPAAARYWGSVVSLAHGALTDPDSPASRSSLLRANLTRTVVLAALATFPNSTLDQHHAPGPETPVPATIRRAASYLEAHACRPVSISEVAQECRVTARTLQYGFKRHLGVSPTQYLRRVRLDRVHHALLAADPTRGDTVAAIAIQYGLSPTSLFTHAYREAYGRLPSDTLRQ